MSDLRHDDELHPVLHWYDFVCPFCYVGQHRTVILERAGLDVVALPFQAHPDIPSGGVLAGRRRGAIYAMLEQEATAAGLVLNWPTRIPDSRRALATSEWVRRHQPDAFAELRRALFEAHFVRGEDIDDPEVLTRYAARLSIDTGAVHNVLADGTAYATVTRAELTGRRCGVDGTPAWMVAGRLLVGLRPASAFQRLAELWAPVPVAGDRC